VADHSNDEANGNVVDKYCYSCFATESRRLVNMRYP
jgi:hypothetical protein